MAKFIIFIARFLNLYLYFILGACLLSWIPNINPQYPLFNLIFKFAGAGILPPVLGFDLGPALLMVILALAWSGLEKLYAKFYAPKQQDIVVLSKEEFIEKMKELSSQNEPEKEKQDDDN